MRQVLCGYGVRCKSGEEVRRFGEVVDNSITWMNDGVISATAMARRREGVAQAKVRIYEQAGVKQETDGMETGWAQASIRRRHARQSLGKIRVS